MITVDQQTRDRYPTRTGDGPARVHRVEPAVWPGVEHGPASRADLGAHERRGYHIVGDMLSAEDVATYRDELHRLSTDPEVRADERTIVEPRSTAVRSIFEVHRISDLIAELIRQPRVLDRARQILGSEVYVHQSRINYMPGLRGGGFYWHSDFETWHAEDGMPAPRAVSLSIALTENHPFNGALLILPESHRTFVSCPGQTPEHNYQTSLQRQQVGVPTEEDITTLAHRHGIDQVTGPAGSALWFDSNSLHASGNNITPLPRANLFVVFNSVHNTLTVPYGGTAPRPSYIASRDATPLTR